MGIKLADTLEPMTQNFPAARAKDVWDNDDNPITNQFSEINSRLDNIGSFINNINELQKRVVELENFSSDSMPLEKTVSSIPK